MTTPVIADVQMEIEKDLKLQRANNELQRLNNELQRVNDELRLTKARAQNYRILTATVKNTGKTAIAIAEFVVGATGLGIEFGTTVYKEYMPSSQQIFHWFGNTLEGASAYAPEDPMAKAVEVVEMLPTLMTTSKQLTIEKLQYLQHQKDILMGNTASA
jgi:hypothetical protein